LSTLATPTVSNSNLSGLVIPERYRPGLAVLLNTPDQAFDELLIALQHAPESAGHKELAAWVSPEVKNIPASDVTKIVDSLTSLFRVRLRTERSVEQLARDVTAALRANLEISETAGEIFAERLSRLLTIKSLNVIETKASELKAEYQHTFCDARVFTDLRPVFGESAEESPSAMLLVHTLKLGYHDSRANKHKEFHLSLDSGDLITLKRAIERAESKSKTLKSKLESAGIKSIDLS
jgi:hypothetical protein